MCSRRVDPEKIIWAFREGDDGVVVGGCYPGDCHYQDGNYRTQTRVALLRRVLDQLGIDPLRLRLEWISAAEGKKFAEVMDDFSEELRKKGPLSLASKEMTV
jgi:F420-non-reducing hydrogenase iron-sulfur subunit